MGMVIASTSVLLLKLSAPEEAGANSAALQISDGLGNMILVGWAASSSWPWAAADRITDARTTAPADAPPTPRPSPPCT